LSPCTDVCVEEDAPWGLARISSRTKGATDYVYDGSAGEGTFSYVVGKSGTWAETLECLQLAYCNKKSPWLTRL
jgi:hypothetical protein